MVNGQNFKNWKRWITTLFSAIAIFFAVNQIFNIRILGIVLFDESYNFTMIAFLLPLIFLHFPLKKRKGNFFWFDNLLFFTSWISCLYLAIHGYDIVFKGYGYSAPLFFTILSILLWVLLIEMIRRSSGGVFTIVVLFFSIYPVFAKYMPGFLCGISRTFDKIAVFHILSEESVMGTLIYMYTTIIIGYIVFGEALVATGGTKILLDFSDFFVSKTRGGPAKLSVISSALFGSLSGSSIANVMVTGSVTIPLMKETGYDPVFAGAVETCASTAGTLTPPIMGATAFVLAAFINKPYSFVALGAVIPAILFYATLFTQIDGEAARKGLRANPRKGVPPMWEVLKKGWFYIPTLLALIYFLFILRWTSRAPFIATAIMLGLAQVRKDTRFSSFDNFLQFLENIGKNLAVLIALTGGAGFLLGSFSLTGIASTFSRELFLLAGDSLPLMILITAGTSFFLGMGMTTIACYIFLSIIAAPILVEAGLNILAVHLFVLYCGMLSYITPPVAMCAFAAATIAKVSPMKIAFKACKLGIALFIVPFFFLLNPSLVLQGGTMQIIYSFITTILGLCIMASGIEGYLIGIGDIFSNYLLRGVLIIFGIFMACPNWKLNLIGSGVILLSLIIKILIQKRELRTG